MIHRLTRKLFYRIHIECITWSMKSVQAIFLEWRCCTSSFWILDQAPSKCLWYVSCVPLRFQVWGFLVIKRLQLFMVFEWNLIRIWTVLWTFLIFQVVTETGNWKKYSAIGTKTWLLIYIFCMPISISRTSSVLNTHLFGFPRSVSQYSHRIVKLLHHRSINNVQSRSVYLSRKFCLNHSWSSFYLHGYKSMRLSQFRELTAVTNMRSKKHFPAISETIPRTVEVLCNL